jgi:hypothetical protein
MWWSVYLRTTDLFARLERARWANADTGTGFLQAFDTAPTWSYTFFAPSNTAFNNTGEYYSTFVATPKGKWWLGNLIQHHYVPNSQLKTSAFTTSYTRIQTGSFLFVGTQVVDGQLILNNVSTVTTGNIPVTSVSKPPPLEISSRDWYSLGTRPCDRPHFGPFSTDIRARCD